MQLVIILIFLSTFSISSALAQTSRDIGVTRELWVGPFNQDSPLKWSGRMELFIRYQSTEGPISGIITWPGLNGSRSEISGNRTGKTIQFTELKCLENCGQAIMGGTYSGTFDDQYRKLDGSSILRKFGLKGTFKLERLMLPD